MYRFIYIALLLWFLFTSAWFAGLSNFYEFNLASGSMLKYYCSQSISVNADYVADEYKTFKNHVLFDNSFLSLTHSSVSATFPNNAIYSISSNLYSAEWLANAWLTSDALTNTFSIITFNTNNGSTELKFVDKNWVTPTTWVTETDNGLMLLVPSWTYDTLLWVRNTTYNFEAYPCVDDWKEPIVYNDLLNSPAVGNHFLWTGVMSGLVIDWNDVNNNWAADYNHYRYQWITPLNLSNYQSAPNSVDAQYGVDSSTLNVRIDNTNASVGYVETPALTITDYVWWEDPDEHTWNSERRWYYLAFKNANDNLFEIEKLVIVTITWYDNYNHSGWRNLMTETFSFNSPSNPLMTAIYPVDNTQDMNPNINQIKFRVTDSWAGVDTTKVWITIPAVTNASGDFIPGFTYSPGPLMFFSGINWTSWPGNSWGYDVTLTLDPSQIPFPADSVVEFTGMVVDLAWNTWVINNRDITTRKPCSYFGCNEILDINIIWWFNAGNYEFTGSYLIATWTNPNSPYPYITWASGDILMCGYEWTWAVLGGNVDVVDSLWVSEIGNIYTENELYITWLDFSYDPVTGIVTVN